MIALTLGIASAAVPELRTITWMTRPPAVSTSTPPKFTAEPGRISMPGPVERYVRSTRSRSLGGARLTVTSSVVVKVPSIRSFGVAVTVSVMSSLNCSVSGAKPDNVKLPPGLFTSVAPVIGAAS